MSEYVFGRNSVLTLLKADPKRIFKVFLAEGHRPDSRMEEIFGLAKAFGLPIVHVPRQKLDAMLPDREMVHQGVIASVSPKTVYGIHELIQMALEAPENGVKPLLLMLDGITDPRNFGAILRVADATGMNGVIVAKQKSAGFGPAVSKTASGAESTVNVAMVANLSHAIEVAKKAGFWVVGAALGDGAIDYFKQDYNMPTLLVMGSEGDGLSRIVREHCDFLVQIPMLGQVESLNVATATAVLAFHIRAGCKHP